MSVRILSRRSGHNDLHAASRCFAHNGRIEKSESCEEVRFSINTRPPFRFNVCPACAALSDTELVNALITEAKRHIATGVAYGTATGLLAKEVENA